MSVADNEYPADEFDRLADTRTIRGTHRRKESNLKWWLALVAVVILAPTAGWAISTYIGSSEEKPAPTASAKPPSGAPGGASSTAGPVGQNKREPVDGRFCHSVGPGEQHVGRFGHRPSRSRAQRIEEARIGGHREAETGKGRLHEGLCEQLQRRKPRSFHRFLRESL